MPTYTYRREDGSTFDYRQKFTDEPLTADPETGRPVVRVVHAAGIIFKGSGFYVNDSRGTDKTAVNSASTDKTDSKTEAKAEKSDKTEKTDSAAKTEAKPKSDANAAAD